MTTLDLRQDIIEQGWISHYTHEGEAKGVDYIYLQNPSAARLPVADWTDMVFSEIARELSRRGYRRPSEAWDLFSGLAGIGGSMDEDAFRKALKGLGFGAGDTLATLTSAEVKLLVSSCDRDGDGLLDAVEWRQRFQEALRRLQGAEIIRDRADPSADLRVIESSLTPTCLESGRWPDPDEWSLSDHGLVISVFRPSSCPPP